MSFDWTGLQTYAFPPFAMVQQVLSHLVWSMDAEVLLIAPLWPSSQWFLPLLELLMDNPRFLPKLDHISFQNKFKGHPMGSVLTILV